MPKEFTIKDYSDGTEKMERNRETDGGRIHEGAGKNYHQSDNYVPNVSGWKIWGDGSVEFGDGKFRGDFEIGGLSKTIDDVADLQTSLDEVADNGGGTVFLKAGTYLLTADINIPSQVTLQGTSLNSVTIDCNTSYKINILGTNAYSTGTVTISDGDTTVVGDSTVWTSAMVGRFINLSGYWYEIATRVSNTEITITDAYSGDNLAGATYVLADINTSGSIKYVVIQNATGTGLYIRYAMTVLLDNIYVIDCGVGVEDSDTVYSKYVISTLDCGTGMKFNNTWGFTIDFSEFGGSTTGHGLEWNNSGSGTFVDSTIYSNTGDGINATDCSNVAIFSVNSYFNGGQGVEFVSGCKDFSLIAFTADGNTSDGIKLTATSDRNSIISSSVINNGGYGINIAAATCDNNQLTAISFYNNTSGNINNAGTATTQLYATIASDTLRDSADTERTTTSITYVKVKEFLFNEADGTVRTKFDLRLDGATATAYGRIYKNGVAFGTEQTNVLNNTYQTKSEDLAFKKDDLIQLYYRQTDGGSSASVRNFRLYYDKILTVSTSTVNTN